VFHDFVPQLNVVLGKKRIVWGAGLAFNPTDLLNPRRDPTDPTFQRAGAWVAQLEAPFETMTFSLLFAPTVLESMSGIPAAFMQPKEGAMTWTCGLALTNWVTPEKEAMAYDLLNAYLSVDTGIYWVENFGMGHANKGVYEHFSNDDLLRRGLTPE
jgi:hypothetical protein